MCIIYISEAETSKCGYFCYLQYCYKRCHPNFSDSLEGWNLCSNNWSWKMHVYCLIIRFWYITLKWSTTLTLFFITKVRKLVYWSVNYRHTSEEPVNLANCFTASWKLACLIVNLPLHYKWITPSMSMRVYYTSKRQAGRKYSLNTL